MSNYLFVFLSTKRPIPAQNPLSCFCTSTCYHYPVTLCGGLLLEELWENYTILEEIFSQLTTKSEGIDDSDETFSRMSELRNRLADKFLAKSQVMVSIAEQLSTIIGNDAIAIHDSSFLAMIVIVAVILLIAMNSMLIGKSILKPIVRLQEGSQIIGEGNFDFKFELSERDEIGELSRSFDTMTARLKQITVARDTLEEEVKHRKRAEARIKESEKLYRGAIEATGAVPYYKNYSNNLFEFIGPGIEALTGYSKEEFTYEVWRSITKEVFLQQEETAGLSFEEAELKVRRGEIDLWQADYRIRTRVGKERWVHNSSVRVRDDQGRVIGSLGALEDITERKRAVDALHNEKEFTETALNAQQDTFFLYEPATEKAVRWNRAFSDITGYTDEEISLMPAPNSYHNPKDLKRAVIFREKVIETGTGSIELELICKGGHKISFEFRVAVIKDEDGNSKYLISIGRDITERKKAEEQIKASLKEKEILLQEIHHRVKNNMQVVASLLNLQKNRIDDEKSKIAFEESRDRINSMGLVHELLYQSESLSNIDLTEYIKKLTDNLFGVGGANLKLDIETISIGINQAIPCGLVINDSAQINSPVFAH